MPYSLEILFQTYQEDILMILNKNLLEASVPFELQQQ